MGKNMKAKKKGRKQIVMNEREVNKLRREAKEMAQESARNATIPMQAIFIQALREEFKFGSDRLCRCLERIDRISTEISGGERTLDDLYDGLKKFGISVEEMYE